MSDILDKAVAALAEKLSGSSIGMVAKFVIENEGAVVVDGNQNPPAISKGEGDAMVTISASQETFQELMSGQLNATAAYMGGKIKIDGDMGAAMKLASALA